VIEAHGLRKSWGDRAVLDDLELVVAPGSLVGIGGANGIGKTTLLRICAGLIAADGGVLGLDGLHPRRDRARYQSRVGFLSAGDRGLYARLTPLQHLELWGRVSLLGRDRFRVAIERTSGCGWRWPSSTSPTWCCSTSRSTRSTATAASCCSAASTS
jgi:ABC-2 type transport system ATP-binding protein